MRGVVALSVALMLCLLAVMPLQPAASARAMSAMPGQPQAQLDTELLDFLKQLRDDFLWQIDMWLKYGSDDDSPFLVQYDVTTGQKVTDVAYAYNPIIPLLWAYSITLNETYLERAEEIANLAYQNAYNGCVPVQFNITSNQYVLPSSISIDKICVFGEAILDLYFATANETYLRWAENILGNMTSFFGFNETTGLFENGDTYDFSTKSFNGWWYGFTGDDLLCFLSLGAQASQKFQGVLDKVLQAYLTTLQEDYGTIVERYYTNGTAESDEIGLGILADVALWMTIPNRTLYKDYAEDILRFLWNNTLHRCVYYILWSGGGNYGTFASVSGAAVHLLTLAYALTDNSTFLEYAEKEFNTYMKCSKSGNYYVDELASDNSKATDKASFMWLNKDYPPALAELYVLTGNTTYLRFLMDYYTMTRDVFKASYGFVRGIYITSEEPYYVKYTITDGGAAYFLCRLFSISTKLLVPRYYGFIDTAPFAVPIPVLRHLPYYCYVLDGTTRALSRFDVSTTDMRLKLTIPSGDLQTIVIYPHDRGIPTSIAIAGHRYTSPVPTREDFDRATTDCWYYDSTTGLIYIKARGHSPVEITISWAAGGPSPAPPSEVPAQPGVEAREEWLRSLAVGTMALMALVVVAYYVLRKRP